MSAGMAGDGNAPVGKPDSETSLISTAITHFDAAMPSIDLEESRRRAREWAAAQKKIKSDPHASRPQVCLNAYAPACEQRIIVQPKAKASQASSPKKETPTKTRPVSATNNYARKQNQTPKPTKTTLTKRQTRKVQDTTTIQVATLSKTKPADIVVEVMAQPHTTVSNTEKKPAKAKQVATEKKGHSLIYFLVLACVSNLAIVALILSVPKSSTFSMSLTHATVSSAAMSLWKLALELAKTIVLNSIKKNAAVLREQFTRAS